MSARLAGLLLVLVFLSGCAGSPAANTPVSPTATPAPSLAPSPTLTATPLPTSTPTPTATPTATPTLVPTPQGGGGKLVLTLFQSAYSGKFNLEGDSNVFVANPDGSELKPLTNGPKGLANLAAAVSPKGDRIAISQVKINTAYYNRENPAGDLFTVKPDGSGLVQLTTPRLRAFQMGVTWLPDNRLLFFGTDEKGQAVFLADPASAAVTRLEKTSGLPYGGTHVVGFNPDRTGIYWATGAACANGPLCNASYYLTKLNDGATQPVWAKLNLPYDRLELSPDGKRIAYFVYSGSYKTNPIWGCFIANIDGSEVKKMEGVRTMCSGGWSPDGGKFIYESYDEKNDRRYLKIWSAADGKAVDLPDHKAGACEGAQWLDAQQVLLRECQSNAFGQSVPAAPRILNLGTGQVTLLAEIGMCHDWAFSPDKRLALVSGCYTGMVSPSNKVLQLNSPNVLKDWKDFTPPDRAKDEGYTYALARYFWIPETR